MEVISVQTSADRGVSSVEWGLAHPACAAPYPSIPVPSYVPEPLRAFLKGHVDPALREAHWLLANYMPVNNGTCPLVFALATLLLTQADAVSNILFKPACKTSSGDRFVTMFQKLYPWAADPGGHTGDQRRMLAEQIYNAYRNPFVHRAGLHHGLPRAKLHFTLKSRDGVDALANSTQPIRTLVEVHPDRSLLHLDTLYWGLRRIIEKLLSDLDGCEQIEKRIQHGLYEKCR